MPSTTMGDPLTVASGRGPVETLMGATNLLLDQRRKSKFDWARQVSNLCGFVTQSS